MILTTKNLTNYWIPEKQRGHGIVLGPMWAAHEALRLRRLGSSTDSGFRWEWTSSRAIEQVLPVIWRMTGDWGARRAVTVTRTTLDRAIRRIVPPLATFLNDSSLVSLWSLASSTAEDYAAIVAKLHYAVAAISRIRKTQQTEPILGTKVLHHFFPSLVPVFDTAFIRRGVFRTQVFREFVRSDSDWLLYKTSRDAGGDAMLEFHRYFALCAFLGDARRELIKAVRERMARGFRLVSPGRMVDDKRSLLWYLDAKAAEYCLVGQAYREGWV